jgi:hypothetical protein
VEGAVGAVEEVTGAVPEEDDGVAAEGALLDCCRSLFSGA